MNIIIFRSELRSNKLNSEKSLPEYQIECWKPSLFSVAPRGFPLFPCLIWCFFHYLYLFQNRDYSIILLRCQEKIVHHTFVLPAHYRFPFMLPYDLQISQVWTSPDERGNGLASYALEKTLFELFSDRNFWYITTETNLASQRLALKSNFKYHSHGRKILSFLGPFISRYQSITISE